MVDNFGIGVMILLAVVLLILTGIFAFSATENLGDSIDETHYRNGYLVKGILYTIYTIICCYFLYLLINILNGILL